MAGVSISRSVVVHMDFTEVEARILKGLVQNPIMDDEPDTIKEFRENVWNALKDVKAY